MIVSGRPTVIVFQLAPPSVLLKPPSEVAAYTVLGAVGSMARARTLGKDGRPVLAALQVAPASVLLNTVSAPTYTVPGLVGSMATLHAYVSVLAKPAASPVLCR